MMDYPLAQCVKLTCTACILHSNMSTIGKQKSKTLSILSKAKPVSRPSTLQTGREIWE